MVTTLLIFHALLSVALIGAITHQLFSVWLRQVTPSRSFLGSFRGVACDRPFHGVPLALTAFTLFYEKHWFV